MKILIILLAFSCMHGYGAALAIRGEDALAERGAKGGAGISVPRYTKIAEEEDEAMDKGSTIDAGKGRLESKEAHTFSSAEEATEYAFSLLYRAGKVTKLSDRELDEAANAIISAAEIEKEQCVALSAAPFLSGLNKDITEYIRVGKSADAKALFIQEWKKKI